MVPCERPYPRIGCAFARRLSGSSFDVSLLDTRSIDASHVSGHREITDVYLLALAAHRGEALATFDMNIRSGAVPGAGKEHLTVISAKR
jgi:hypothetical protein